MAYASGLYTYLKMVRSGVVAHPSHAVTLPLEGDSGGGDDVDG